jgi:hypothetical protein
LIGGWRGAASVVTNVSYSGTEDAYFEFLDGRNLCTATWDMDDSFMLSTCSDCQWAFKVELSNGTETGPGCSGLGWVAADSDGTQYGYGYAPTYGSYTDVLMYQYGSTWYAVAYATWTGTSSSGTFSYDWPRPYYYYY